jgi:hypothetical protein
MSVPLPLDVVYSELVEELGVKIQDKINNTSG